MAATFNLEHSEVGPDTESTLDVAGSISLDLSITSTANYLAADAQRYAVAWSAPEGSGTAVFGESDFGVLAVVNGGTTSTSGTGDTLINRYEQPGVALNPEFLLSGFARNMSQHTPDIKAFRVTIPSATAPPATLSLGQETWTNWSLPISFTDVGDNLVIYEQLGSVPTLVDGVMGEDINIEAPTP